jgi:hypothetical protein
MGQKTGRHQNSIMITPVLSLMAGTLMYLVQNAINLSRRDQIFISGIK